MAPSLLGVRLASRTACPDTTEVQPATSAAVAVTATTIRISTTSPPFAMCGAAR